MPKLLNIFLLLILSLGNSYAVELIPPKSSFNGPHLNIESPNSNGWYLVETSPGGMSFAKDGEEKHSSYGAQVLGYPLEPITSESQFVSILEKQLEQDNSDPRYDVLSKSLNYFEDRGYPCVRVDTKTLDKKAKISTFRKKKLTMQAFALYCEHPHLENFGIAIIYSYRAKTPLDGLEAEALSFFEGVVVPEPKQQ